MGSKHNSGYSAAKFGGVGLTQSLALDLAEYGITVHSLMLQPAEVANVPVAATSIRPSLASKKTKWSSITSTKCR